MGSEGGGKGCHREEKRAFERWDVPRRGDVKEKKLSFMV